MRKPSYINQKHEVAPTVADTVTFTIAVVALDGRNSLRVLFTLGAVLGNMT